MIGAITLVFPASSLPAGDRVRVLLSGCAHYQRSDLPLFLAAYNELCRLDLDGGRILEICCGAGDLAAGMARVFPKTEVTAMDRYPDAGRAVKDAATKDGLHNVRFQCGDALRLTGFADASLDLLYGQATLHHLAHDLDAVRDEFSRVLKPGGRLIFIYEPLGHNPLWAMIRAWRNAKSQMPDESNVFVPQVQWIAQSFSSCNIQPFNFIGYPLKSFGRLACLPLVHFVHTLDLAFMKRSPLLTRMAANFNVVFVK
jgi:SAM-dependent methyltransferase